MSSPRLEGKAGGHLSLADPFQGFPKTLPLKRQGKSCLRPSRRAGPSSLHPHWRCSGLPAVPRPEKPSQRFPRTDLPGGLQYIAAQGPISVQVLGICCEERPLISLPRSPPPIRQGLGGPQFPVVAGLPPRLPQNFLFWVLCPARGSRRRGLGKRLPSWEGDACPQHQQNKTKSNLVLFTKRPVKCKQ